ncbi:hypothetical protein ACJ6WF_41680 [Streptomyces sp. MMS24-I2-30]|uniref:hypothetical protein n=1 Tax=Streptomyces sp. MMS24-I2-30 TaxID=3351564 RepID=UPI003896CFFB
MEDLMDQHTTGDASADRIWALYFPQDGSDPLVPHGKIPTARRKDAPDWEAKARIRMYTLLNPVYRANAAEEEVLTQAGIPLLPRGDADDGFYIDRTAPRESDDTTTQANADNAKGIARLYGLDPNFPAPALVPHGEMPAQRRKGAPDWERQARKRVNHLLDSSYRASPAEEEVLKDAGIPLKERGDAGDGFYIDPRIMLEYDVAAVQAKMNSATGIARLYGLDPNFPAPALVPYGEIPTAHREGAPDWERQARKRMHNLLNPKYRASPAEEKVLWDAGIPLKERKNGGFHIDREKPMQSDRENAGSSAMSTLPPGQQPWTADPTPPQPTTAALYALTPQSPAYSGQASLLSPYGQSYMQSSYGASTSADPSAAGWNAGNHTVVPGPAQPRNARPHGTHKPKR